MARFLIRDFTFKSVTESTLRYWTIFALNPPRAGFSQQWTSSMRWFQGSFFSFFRSPNYPENYHGFYYCAKELHSFSNGLTFDILDLNVNNNDNVWLSDQHGNLLQSITVSFLRTIFINDSPIWFLGGRKYRNWIANNQAKFLLWWLVCSSWIPHSSQRRRRLFIVKWYLRWRPQ